MKVDATLTTHDEIVDFDPLLSWPEISSLLEGLTSEERRVLAAVEVIHEPQELSDQDRQALMRVFRQTAQRLSVSKTRRREVLADLQGRSLSQVLADLPISEDAKRVPDELTRAWNEVVKQYARDVEA